MTMKWTMVLLALAASTGDTARVVQNARQSEKDGAHEAWWQEAKGAVWNFFKTGQQMYDAFSTMEACAAMQILNPIAWWQAVGNVMEFKEGEADDADEMDHTASSLTLSGDVMDAKHMGFELDPKTLAENLNNLDPGLVKLIWSQRFKNHNADPIDWLTKHVDELKHSLGLLAFVRLVQEAQQTSDVSEAVKFMQLVKVIEDARGKVSSADTQRGESPSRREPKVILSEDDKALATASKTDMFENPRWRNKLLQSIWPHLNDMGSFQVRMATGSVGNSPEDAHILGMSDKANTDAVARGAAISFASKVTAWLSLDEELLQEMWKEASAALRVLPGIDKEANYQIGVTFRAMKAGGLLDKSGKDLPGVVWHKDVYSEHVAIIYPFCFLPGYNNEITTTAVYKEKDPEEEHLGKFTHDLSSSTFVQTVAEGSNAGFGEIIAFDNALTRHRAHPPTSATRETVLKAMHLARDWGVPGVGEGQALRAMIHISMRKVSTDMVTMLSKYAPVSLISMFRSPLTCLLKLPGIEAWSLRDQGGFAQGEMYLDGNGSVNGNYDDALQAADPPAKAQVAPRCSRECYLKKFKKDANNQDKVNARDATCIGELVCARKDRDGRSFGDCPGHHCCSEPKANDQDDEKAHKDKVQPCVPE